MVYICVHIIKKCSFICVLAHCPKKAFKNPGFLLILWLKFNWINQKTVRLTHINTFGSSATTMHVCAQLGSDWSTVVITNQKYIIQSDHTEPFRTAFQKPVADVTDTMSMFQTVYGPEIFIPDAMTLSLDRTPPTAVATVTRCKCRCQIGELWIICFN